MYRLFKNDSIVDILRTVHRYKNKTNSEDIHYSLINVTTRDSDVLSLPYSEKTLYSLYVGIAKNAKIEFDKELDKDKIKSERFTSLKLHDDYINNCYNDLIDDIEKHKSIFDKIYDKIVNLVINNTDLVDDFNNHKVMKFITDTINDERYLLDMHYIRRYLKVYDDIDLDWEKILISSINYNNRKVSGITKRAYPIITDYSTAQIYLNNVCRQTYDDNDRCDRMYYRIGINDKIIKDIQRYHKKLDNSTLIKSIIIDLIFSILSAYSSVDHTLFPLFYTGLIASYIIIKHFRHKNENRNVRSNIKREDSILDELSSRESDFIRSKFRIY